MVEENCSCKSIETHQEYRLIWVWATVTFIAVAVHFLSQFAFPGQGPVLTRSLILEVVPDVIASTILMTALVLFDKITPGNTIACAGEDPLSAAILLGSFVVGLAIVMAGM
jgi:ABC-type maltose transport system permease subunit